MADEVLTPSEQKVLDLSVHLADRFRGLLLDTIGLCEPQEIPNLLFSVAGHIVCTCAASEAAVTGKKSATEEYVNRYARRVAKDIRVTLKAAREDAAQARGGDRR